jgi:hypothetical protein
MTELKKRKQLKKSNSRDNNNNNNSGLSEEAPKVSPSTNKNNNNVKVSNAFSNDKKTATKAAFTATSTDPVKHANENLVNLYRRMSRLGQSYESLHKVRDSLLSSSSGYTNYRGFLNLCVVLLVMSTGRLVIENLLKYGLLVRFDVPFLFIQDPTAWPSLLALVCKKF